MVLCCDPSTIVTSYWEVLSTRARGETVCQTSQKVNRVHLKLCQLLHMNFMCLLLSISLTYTSLPAAALTLLAPLHSTASLNTAILAPVGPVMELWSPLGHIHTTGSVMKLWIFHRSPDTNCLFLVHPVSAVLFCTVYADRRGETNSTISLIFFHTFLAMTMICQLERSEYYILTWVNIYFEWC